MSNFTANCYGVTRHRRVGSYRSQCNAIRLFNESQYYRHWARVTLTTPTQYIPTQYTLLNHNGRTESEQQEGFGQVSRRAQR